MAEHGGSPGLRDEGALDAALNRPRTLAGYEDDTDLCRITAAYAQSFVRNHAFVDGNKRVAFMACYIFLGINGLRHHDR